MKIIVASGNDHKVREIRYILKDLDMDVVSLKDEKIDIDVVEDGKTFEENAYKKAHEIYKYLKKNGRDKDTLVLADDSGLMVDALKGAPGIFSARYAGEHGNDGANNRKLLEEMQGIPMEERTARFICSMVLLGKDTDIRSTGESDGYIIEEEKGFDGFGYDPLFHSKDLDKTFAEASEVEKNSVSHRFRALKGLKDSFRKEIAGEKGSGN